MASVTYSIGGKYDGSAVSKAKKGLSSFAGIAPSLFVVGQAFGKITEFIKKAVAQMAEMEKAWAEVEQTALRLDFASKINGQLGATGTSLKNFANDLSDTLKNTIGAGDIQKAMASLSFDKTETEIKAITTAAVDLSVAMGISLESAMDQLSNTMSGTTGTLGKQFPALKTLTQEQLAAGDAIAIVSEKVKGMASAMSDTTTGSLARYQDATNALKEEMGSLISDFFTPMRDWLSNLASGWAKALEAKRKYKEDKVAVENGTADSSQLKILKDEAERNYETLLAIAEEAQKGYLRTKDTANNGTGTSRFYAQNNLPEAETKATNAAKKAQEAYELAVKADSEYRKKRTEEKNAIAQAEKDAVSKKVAEDKAKAEAEKIRIQAEKEASDKRIQVELELQNKLLEIKNKVSSKEISQYQGDRLTAELTDSNFNKANAILSDSSASSQSKEAAQLFIKSFSAYWDNQKPVERAKEEKPTSFNPFANLNGQDIEGKYIVPSIEKIQYSFRDLGIMAKSLDFSGVLNGLGGVTGVLENMGQLGQVISMAMSSNPIGIIISVISEMGSMFMNLENVGETFNFITTILQNMFSVIGPSISAIFEPFADILAQVGAIIGTQLLPILQLVQAVVSPIMTVLQTLFAVISPIIGVISQVLSIFVAINPLINIFTIALNLLANTIAFLYNKILLPITNFALKLISSIGNFFIAIYNGIVSVLNGISIFGWHPFNLSKQATIDYDAIKLEEIAAATSNTAGVSGTGKTVAGATYTAAKDITVNIYYNGSYINGDSRQIALNLREELRAAEALGY